MGSVRARVRDCTRQRDSEHARQRARETRARGKRATRTGSKKYGRPPDAWDRRGQRASEVTDSFDVVDTDTSCSHRNTIAERRQSISAQDDYLGLKAARRAQSWPDRVRSAFLSPLAAPGLGEAHVHRAPCSYDPACLQTRTICPSST